MDLSPAIVRPLGRSTHAIAGTVVAWEYTILRVTK